MIFTSRNSESSFFFDFLNTANLVLDLVKAHSDLKLNDKFFKYILSKNYQTEAKMF